jgi:hypothetical protein
MSVEHSFPSDIDYIGVKSRLKAAMFDRNLGIRALQARCGVTQEALERAFDTIERGDPEAVRVLSLAATGIGVAPEWVLGGYGPCPLKPLGRVVRLGWEYVYRNRIAFDVGKQFEAWLRGRFQYRPLIGNQMYRDRPPQRVEGIAPLFNQFLNEMNS